MIERSSIGSYNPYVIGLIRADDYSDRLKARRIHQYNVYLKMKDLLELLRDPVAFGATVAADAVSPLAWGGLAESIRECFGLDFDQDHAAIFVAAHECQADNPQPDRHDILEKTNALLSEKGVQGLSLKRFDIVIQALADKGCIRLSGTDRIIVVERLSVVHKHT